MTGRLLREPAAWGVAACLAGAAFAAAAGNLLGTVWALVAAVWAVVATWLTAAPEVTP